MNTDSMAQEDSKKQSAVNAPDNSSESSKTTQVNIDQAIATASSWLAPAWDVRDYVAVNPFFGLRHKSFIEGIQYASAATAASLLPNLSFFKQQYWKGKITNEDISFALNYLKLKQGPDAYQSLTVDAVVESLEYEINDDLKIKVLSDLHGEENSTDTTEFITQEVSKWLAAYFDEGQAQWKMPFKEKRLYYAWRKVASLDKSLDKKGIPFQSYVSALPLCPKETIDRLSKELIAEFDLTQEMFTNYLYRLIASVMGWASYVQKFEFEATRSGQTSELKRVGGLIDLLALRMVYDTSLKSRVLNRGKVRSALAISPEDFKKVDYRYVWLLAKENAYRNELLLNINNEPRITDDRPRAQMAFCIDVRSEVIRRKIEEINPEVETIGFAGFFGMPISYQRLGHQSSEQHCPILLNSAITVQETSEQKEALAEKKLYKAALLKAKKNIKAATNSCFSFVETMGWSYIYKMLKSATGKSKPNLDFESMGLDSREQKDIKLDFEAVDFQTRLNFAYGALKNMGLTKKFAPYVIFFGHASESSNNPYASGLDCGACAGHSGLPNSKFLAGLLNDQLIRQKLESDHGIAIPDDTVFLAGLHNTTLDELTVIHDELEGEALKNFKLVTNLCMLAQAATQSERGFHMSFCENLDETAMKKEMLRKANDWSEIRPEWGLAGNGAFVVARRERTRGRNLEGRSFLHNYRQEDDIDSSTLELIMTAPMVVTNWINMQYYASAVDSNKFGSGNKTLHNVVGTIGAIQGNSSDLLVGLSEQSVKYKDKYVHEPVRLQVVIEATTESMDQIIEKHQLVKELVDNEWVNLISLDPNSSTKKLYLDGGWLDLA